MPARLKSPANSKCASGIVTASAGPWAAASHPVHPVCESSSPKADCRTDVSSSVTNFQQSRHLACQPQPPRSACLSRQVPPPTKKPNTVWSGTGMSRFTRQTVFSAGTSISGELSGDMGNSVPAPIPKSRANGNCRRTRPNSPRASLQLDREPFARHQRARARLLGSRRHGVHESVVVVRDRGGTGTACRRRPRRRSGRPAASWNGPSRDASAIPCRCRLRRR